jgi:hypothetical protein
MWTRFRHAQHALRVVVLLALGLVAFLVLRWALIPSDFGVYGFYRAGALNDIKARPIAYAGRAACEECHAGTYEPPDDSQTAKAAKAVKAVPVDLATDNKHSVLRCEACHGPLAVHVEDPEKPVAKVGVDHLCLGCHLQLTGRPESQPQVLPGDHGDNDPCISCHKPHRPKTDDGG